VQRAIVGFHQDDEGDWVAELACGHRQPWEHEPEALLGTPLECRLCDQGGEAACFEHLVCPECGVVLNGSPHRPDCPART
jgi:hypothetical protein